MSERSAVPAARGGVCTLPNRRLAPGFRPEWSGNWTSEPGNRPSEPSNGRGPPSPKRADSVSRGGEPSLITVIEPLVDLQGVSVVLDGRKLLGPLSWQIQPGQHWVVVGPNGGGKSTLMRIASLAQHPSDGVVRILGHQLGKVDIRHLRSRIGVSSASLVDQLRGSLTANEIVKCGLYAALEPWWHTYGEADEARADRLLAQVGLDGYAERTFGTLSSGERQRALLARTLMAEPDVLVLDEPTAGLDLGGRESLVTALEAIAESNGPATVFVTHHVEDIPRSTTHVLAVAGGQPLAVGEIDDVLSSALLSEMFGLPVTLDRRDGRWSARAAVQPPDNDQAGNR